MRQEGPSWNEQTRRLTQQMPQEIRELPGGQGPSGTSLSWRLRAEPIPSWFKQPTDMKAYDGSSDPKEFVTVFRATMSLCGESDSLLCRTFPVFLRKQALEWFTGLPVNSIDSWADLSHRFIQQFAHCGPQPKTTQNLCGVRQKPGEKVREYYERFQAEARQVKGKENQTYLLLFTTGLQPGGLADTLAKKGPATKEELMEKIRKYIDLEVFRSSQRQIEQGFREATFRRSDKPAGRRQFDERRPRVVGERFRETYKRDFTPLNTSRAQILKEVMSTEMQNVPRPPPIRSSYAQADKTKLCKCY
ncbi:uncharacterized protein LOC133287676 [Gastrolobium bilobum]|uniref:uncharacterized protein LOC133287676 n=1 Tax=Gastrolobium bilobum TaxID=150636 RepID=UPI002AAF8E1C|nr:uncharacterized protein LOC133287676 [Gastrolobium bilobum]